MLSAEQRSVILHAAAVGRSFDGAFLARLTARSSDVIREALREAIGVQLVVERDGAPGSYAFRHALTHRIVYGELLAEERRDLHARIAALIEADDAPQCASELLYHWNVAGEPARAARYAEAAGDAALEVGLAVEPDHAAPAMARNRQGRRPDELTRREREISSCVAAGRTNREIAGELFVSERTVEDHVASILRKLGLKNRAHLAAHVAHDRDGLLSRATHVPSSR
jgi:DNA-binding CsgD family transcriptional regulator